jgi:small subunit ribosomal protein S16
MLKIKLARFGKKHQPHYRIVVNEARDKRDGRYTALVGHYSPVAPKTLVIDVAAYEEWMVKGAKPTETVEALFRRFQSGNPFPVKPTRPSKKSLAKAAAAKDAVKEEAAPAVETEVVEAAAEPAVEAEASKTE